MNTSPESAPHSPRLSVGRPLRRDRETPARPRRAASRAARSFAAALALLFIAAALLTAPRTGATGGGAQTASCQGTLLFNGNFVIGNNQGTMPAPGAVAGWAQGYGAPQVFKTAGCVDNGFVRLSGNRVAGSAVAQTFNPANKIKQNKKYVLSACVRNVPGASYVKFRAVAFNGSLPASTAHPAPGPSLAVIGRSGMINSNDWTEISLPSWTAWKDYDSLAISAESNDGTTLSVGDIDNVCLTEVAEHSCEEAQTGPDGQVVFPANLDPDAPPTYEDVNEFNGTTADIYGSQCNTQLDTWYQNCEPPCASIGGQVPPEAGEDRCSEELEGLGAMSSPAAPGQLGTAMSCGQLQSALDNFKPPPSRQAKLPPLPAATPPTCPATPPADNSQPFGGADIIFLHGLRLDHLCDRANNVPGALQDWPNSPGEFYNGYYKNAAEQTWEDHIQHFLKDRGAKNRYLVVSYNSSQRLKVAAHAVLSQIRQAMINGQGVVTPPGVAPDCFAKKFVLISYSTGSLVGDVALSVAERTKTDPTVSAEFGQVGYIADRARVHVALHGAFSGSHLATALVAASQNPGLQPVASFIVTKMSCQTTYANLAPTVKTSILLDLMPQVAQAPAPAGWRDHVNSVPVPVLTVAGGHPGGTLEWSPLVKQGLHKGLDDGVLTMDSQCGNPNPVSSWPSRVTAVQPLLYKLKLFDPGIAFPRAVGYFIDQTFGTPPQTFAAGCVPFVTPYGMLTPKAVINPAVSPLNRYHNHCSLMQTASGHYAGPIGLPGDPYGTGANYAPPNYNYEPTLGTPNSEEVRAITCPSLYSSGLVSANMQNMVNEHVRGKKVCFTIKLFGKKKTFTKWIWKRTYHLLDGFETKSEGDYVYDNVLKP